MSHQANRKEHRSSRNVSFEPVHSVSVRGHRHQASDSGVGSDQDSYGTSPDRSTAAQAYYDLQKAHRSLKEEVVRLQEDLRNALAHSKALENRVEVLTNDNNTLNLEKKTLKSENEALHAEVRKARNHQPREREAKMSGANPAPPASPKEKEKKSSTRGESRVRKSDDKDRKERKDYEKRCKEDKERLKNRFDHKESSTKDDNSSTSSSGRSKRESYVEPFGPPAPRSTVSSSNAERSRRGSTYSHSRPTVIATTTLAEPAYSGPPRNDYDKAVYDDYVEGGDYHPYPLQTDPYASRGRSRY
ncbi:hypothetical protein C8035_v001254 [Colletotrichum spinosum]|uniref:Uncharacterized protein n=1 Tax=Colletotrichum spinosum TaxID=1347390 RepID=A0A4V3HT27_9PEZI|nr:hypothetical protein C8035_v001254 [Colletotrichum spinosum]